MGVCLARAGTFAPTTDARWNFSAGGWASSGSADDGFGGVKQGNSTTANDAVVHDPVDVDGHRDRHLRDDGAERPDLRGASRRRPDLDAGSLERDLQPELPEGCRRGHPGHAHDRGAHRHGPPDVRYRPDLRCRPPVPSLPRVQVIGLPQSYGAAGYVAIGGGVNHATITDAEVVTLNTAYQSVCAEFDNKVKFCDMDAAFSTSGTAGVDGRKAFGTSGSLSSDALNVHPSARGHQVYAEKVLTDLYAMPQSGLSFAGGPPTYRRLLAAGGSTIAQEPVLSTNWTQPVAGGFVRTGNGQVTFKGRLTKGAAGVLERGHLHAPGGRPAVADGHDPGAGAGRHPGGHRDPQHGRRDLHLR
jgi:hypothetical protein